MGTSERMQGLTYLVRRTVDGSLVHYLRSKTYFVLMHFWIYFVDIGEEQAKSKNLKL
jgi:hypothetical protein